LSSASMRASAARLWPRDLASPSAAWPNGLARPRMDRCDFGPPDQGQLTSEERAELARLHKENRELRREKHFFRLAAAHLGIARRVSAEQ
jgi:hypothetical protein